MIHSRFPRLLWPCFRLQYHVQERTLGVKAWKAHSSKLRNAASAANKKQALTGWRKLCSCLAAAAPPNANASANANAAASASASTSAPASAAAGAAGGGAGSAAAAAAAAANRFGRSPKPSAGGAGGGGAASSPALGRDMSSRHTSEQQKAFDALMRSGGKSPNPNSSTNPGVAAHPNTSKHLTQN